MTRDLTPLAPPPAPGLPVREPVHESVDLAILDAALTPGGREGLDILRTIRTLKPWLPVIVFSGVEGIEAEARRLGANAVVGKPHFWRLARTVNDLLARPE